jgi:1,2-diacylglycerol 3-beta-glucosyltransferase
MNVGSAGHAALQVAILVAGGMAAGYALYLLVLSVAAFFYRAFPRAATPPTSRLAVVVPAHDEAGTIGRCVRSLRNQTYPADLYEVLVVADNCSDDTAAIAANEGARILVRHEPAAHGKGRALRWAIQRVLAATPPPDAIVVVDADSVADVNFLAALVRPFEAGAPAVQGESLLAEEPSGAGSLRVAAFLLVNRVRPAGRVVLGLPCMLAGNGMLLGRGLLLAHPWDAFTSTEDVEYSLGLRMAGVEIAFAGGAVLVSPLAPNPRAAATQQLRWEGGKLTLARTWTPRLVREAVRRRRLSLLATALDLAGPPLGYFTAVVAAATAICGGLAWAGTLPAWAVVPWLVALISVPILVLVGLRAGRASGSSYRAMLRAPLFVVAKLRLLPRLMRFRADTWVRTERSGWSRADH